MSILYYIIPAAKAGLVNRRNGTDGDVSDMSSNKAFFINPLLKGVNGIRILCGKSLFFHRNRDDYCDLSNFKDRLLSWFLFHRFFK